MDTARYLYVSRAFDGDIRADDLVRNNVFTVFPQAEQVGSGTGGGMRDMEFVVLDALTQEQINALHATLVKSIGTDVIHVLYDEWEGGESILELIAE